MIPHFIYDDELDELQTTIRDLIREKKHPELKKHVKTLKTFTRAIVYSLAKEKPKILPKKQIQLQLVKQPIGFDISPAPSPGEFEKQAHEFKAIPIYSEEIIAKKELPKEIVPREQIVSLIRDKFTNKVLATATINNAYEIKEPDLNELNKKIVNKILRKKPKTPEKTWKLIEKYIKKFKSDPLHKEAIKYYIINNLFALGKIEPLLHDKEVFQITCDSPGSYIKVKRNNKTLKTNILFNTKQALDNFLFLIAEKTNSKLNKKHPTLDATYRNFRFHCVLGLDITTSKFTITRI